MTEDLLQLATRAKFPIRDHAELGQLVTDNANLTVRGKILPLKEALTLLPNYYFPIGSEADLISKLADLAVCIPASEQEFVGEWQKRTGEQTGVSPVDCWS
jgi:hypothetical protein